MFNVEVADKSGHSIVQMNQEEIANKAASDNSAWVFVNDQLVSAADIADMDLEVGSRIRMMPGLVGGNDAPTFVVQTADKHRPQRSGHDASRNCHQGSQRQQRLGLRERPTCQRS